MISEDVLLKRVNDTRDDLFNLLGGNTRAGEILAAIEQFIVLKFRLMNGLFGEEK